MSEVTIHIGDCIEQMRNMPDESVDTVITSPPYWGLRDYGNEAQLGLEKTVGEYVTNMVKVFDEVKRILKPQGTLWLNLGDSYNGSGGSGGDYNKGGIKEGQPKYGKKNTPSLKPKDLVGVPWRVAFALQEAGWWLRQDIIWAKPNCMPESVTDRCTKNHEYMFLLTKSQNYYFDHEAIKEPVTGSSKPDKKAYAFKYGDDDAWAKDGDKSRKSKAKGIAEARTKEYTTRNKRSVWWVGPKPFPEAHFAVFPIELIEPCVLAGSPVGGTVFDPFGGAGTTAIAAIKHGRNAILTELSREYVEIAEKRIGDFKLETGLLKDEVRWL